MKILDEYFGLLRDGAKDTENRQKAQELYSKIADRLRTIKSSDVVDVHREMKNNAAAFVDISDATGIPDTSIIFRPHDESVKTATAASFMYGEKEDEKSIVVNVPVKDRTKKLDPKSWQAIFMVRKNNFIKDHKSAVIHEIVHLLDFMRIKDPSRVFNKVPRKDSTSKDSESAYLNSPIETNAYFQQGLSALDDYLKDANKRSDIYDKVGRDHNEFYRFLISKFFSKNCVGALSKKNQAKFKKRMMQYWVELMQKVGDQEAIDDADFLKTVFGITPAKKHGDK